MCKMAEKAKKSTLQSLSSQVYAIDGQITASESDRYDSIYLTAFPAAWRGSVTHLERWGISHVVPMFGLSL